MQNENNYTNNNNNNTPAPVTQNNTANNDPHATASIKESNGLGSSITSALLFFIVCLPYFIGCLQDDYGMFIVMGGALIFPFIITCYIFGKLAISKYKSFTGEKTTIRKILNAINTISVIVITLPLIIFTGILFGTIATAFPPLFIIALVCIIAIIAIYVYIKEKKNKGGKQ